MININKIQGPLSFDFLENPSDDFSIIRRLLFRIIFVQMAICMAPMVNVLVDGFIAGKYLSENDIAAIQLQSVVETFISLTFMMTEGGRILLTEFIGRGQKRQITELVSTLFFSLVAVGTVLTAVLSVFCVPVAHILGAKGECVMLCAEYVKSSAWGIVPRICTNLLLNLAVVYHLEGANYLATLSGIVINAGMDILLVGKFSQGIRGMGLATSMSYLFSCLILFVICNRRIHFGQKRTKIFNAKLLPGILKNGLPLVMLKFGIFIGNYGMNMIIVQLGGMPGAAVAMSRRLLIIISTILISGTSDAFALIGGILYNEKDRTALVRLFKTALRLLLTLMGIVVALSVVFRENITRIYFSPADEAYNISNRMLVIAPAYLLLYAVYILFFRLYQIEKRTKIVNVLALIESPGIAVCSLLLGLAVGLDGVWAGNFTMELICIFIIWCYGRRNSNCPWPGLDDMLLIPDAEAFGEDYFSISVKSEKDVLNVSRQVMEYFKKRENGKSIAFHASLCIEEIAGNIVKHGFTNKNMIVIRMYDNKDSTMISIRDNCRMFDPIKRLEAYDNTDPIKDAGIRLIAGVAEEMHYIDTLGLNTLVIKLKKNR